MILVSDLFVTLADQNTDPSDGLYQGVGYNAYTQACICIHMHVSPVTTHAHVRIAGDIWLVCGGSAACVLGDIRRVAGNALLMSLICAENEVIKAC